MKTGITEVSVVGAAVGIFEPALEAVTGGAIHLPEPWGQLAVGLLSVGIFLLRARQKKLEGVKP